MNKKLNVNMGQCECDNRSVGDPPILPIGRSDDETENSEKLRNNV